MDGERCLAQCPREGEGSGTRARAEEASPLLDKSLSYSRVRLEHGYNRGWGLDVSGEL
jgi:hypothetical protein